MTAAEAHGEFGILAHVDVPSGFEQQNPGAPPRKFDVICCHRALAAIELKHANSDVFYSAADPVADRARIGQARIVGELLGQFFSLSKDDISAVFERFRDDRCIAAAIQLLFLRASGRPMDRFPTVPKVLLRSVREALGSPSVSFARLRSLFERRQTQRSLTPSWRA